MPDLNWLTSVPIAHRGFHNPAKGILENSRSAVRAAMENDFSIEVDLQETADHRAVVFHDFTLDRLTGAKGTLASFESQSLLSISLKNSDDRIWSFDELLEEVSGKVGLCLEIKSSFRRVPTEFLRNLCESASDYGGPLAFKSFDPDILGTLKKIAPQIPRGIVADSTRNLENWGHQSVMERFILRNLLHFPRSRPSFVSYCVNDLPSVAPYIAKYLLGLPVVTWTVRTKNQLAVAQKWADQIVFEGFNPKSGIEW